jgi:hypothetical protein
MHLVTITWAGYEFQDRVEQFGDFVVASKWLTATGAEYGVGHGTHARARIYEKAPATLDDAKVFDMITQWISAGRIPAPDGQTLYVLYVPASTWDFIGPSDQGCVRFGGYHSRGSASNQPYSYAVVLDCRGALDGVTTVASHEVIEAATDPGLSSFSLRPDFFDPWTLARFQEAADMCENAKAATEGGYHLARSWSNAAAKAGMEPCVPDTPFDVYFNVSVDPATIQAASPGDTLTFTLTGWSASETDPWVVVPVPGDLSELSLGISLDTSTLQNGQKATLNVTVPANATSGQTGYIDLLSKQWSRAALVGVRVR